MSIPERQVRTARPSLFFVEIKPEPAYKRPLDLGILLVAHLLLLPLWILIWTLIPLAILLEDGGPILYTQTRIGKGGRLFAVRKFRSMV